MTDKPSSIPSRRQLGAAVLAGALFAGVPAYAETDPDAEHLAHMPPRPDRGPKLKVAMLVYPRMIMIDLAVPQTVLNIVGSDIHLAGKTMQPVSTDIGLYVTPTCTFADCPTDLDVLFVPGGLMGSIAAMQDEATLQFLTSRASTARYVTSVCTGGLVLAASGLLRGYRATAHWGVADLLPLMGATRAHERVVQDRNRLTGAGATASMDFALTLAALLRGEEEAKRVQLILEYSPKPPFVAGTPEEVGSEKLAEARRGRVWMDAQARKASEAAAIRLGLAPPNQTAPHAG